MSYNLCERRQLVAGLAIILAVAFLLRLCSALGFPSIHHPDEIFQYLEQAHRVVFGYGVIPWEYRDGTRSWIVPGFLSGFLKISESLGLSEPGIYLFLVTATLSALSLSVVLVGFLWANRTQGPLAGLITAALCGVWFELIYFAPKTLAEPIAAHILLIAVYLAYPGQPTANKRRLFAAGLLFGLVVAIRVNLAPALLVAAVYICRREVSDKWIPLVLGGVVTFVLAGILDAFTWQYPFQSFVSNIWINIVEQKSRRYGVSPWYFYVREWVFIWGFAIVPIATLSLLAMRKNLLLGLIAAAIIATHMLIAHKEYRFVFPAVPFVVMLMGLGTAEVFGYIQDHVKTRKLILTALVVIVLGWPMTSGVLAFNGHFRPNWFRGAGEIHAFRFLYDKSDMCGVGLLYPAWWDTGGYTHLHRDVPIIIPEENIATSFSAYNYALANPLKLPDYWPYSKVGCWSNDRLCVYHRDGLCERAPDMEANEVLRRRGA